MTARGWALLAISLSALLCGMSLGGRIFYLTALFAVLALLFSLLSILFSRWKMRVHAFLSAPQVLRGETAHLTVTAGKRGLLPVYPLDVTVLCGDTQLTLTAQPSFLQEQSISLPLPAQHVGLFSVGISEYVFYDVLGLFRARVRCKKDSFSSLTVLPRPFDVEELHFLPGDDGRALPNRTAEDLSSPEDTRPYRRGDSLKRVHWKISARKRELIVRRFETPAPPDTLVLLDCSQPGGEDDTDETRLTLRDALCETALSVISMQLKSQSPVRMPLYGTHAQEFHSSAMEDLPHLQRLLACQPFMGDAEFDRVLHMELRRMRQTGVTVIVTTHLTASVVEGVKHIRLMGPGVRLYLITRTPDNEEDRPYVTQLQQCLVEVCYVTPA